MKVFSDLLLRRKLTVIMTMTSSATLLLVSVAWLSYDWYMMRQSMIEKLSLVGELVSAGTVESVENGDRNAVEAHLRTLLSREDIKSVHVFDTRGKVMAAYERRSESFISLYNASCRFSAWSG